MAAKLTREACRAARALLGITTQEFAARVGVSPTTINGIEAGNAVRESTERRIVEALDRLGVEITNGDGTGARLRFGARPSVTAGSYRVLGLKDGSGFFARWTPDSYGPEADGPAFPTEAEAQAWADGQRLKDDGR